MRPGRHARARRAATRCGGAALTGARIGPWRRLALALGALSLAAGCSSFEPVTSPATLARMSGSWVLDPDQSDDVRASIDGALPRPRPGPAAPGHAGAHAAARHEIESRITPAQRLDLLADPGHFVVTDGGRGSRSFEPGETFLRADEFGPSEVSSGWRGQAYVVREKPLDGQGKFTETFEVDAAGRLLCTRAISIPQGGKATIRSVYLPMAGTRAGQPRLVRPR